MKSLLYFCDAEINSIKKKKAVKYLVGACVVMTALSMRWMVHSVFALWVELCRAHVVYASAWVAGRLGWATQTNAILLQNGFSHFFNVVACSSLVTLPNGHQCYVSVPNNERSPLQPWSVCCWDQCECLTENASLWFDHKYTHIRAHVCICCDLTVFRLLFAVEPPSDLKFKILNENTVEMSWRRPSSRIEGFRIQVVSDAGQ